MLNPQPEGKPRSCSSSMQLVAHALCVAFFADYIFRVQDVHAVLNSPFLGGAAENAVN